MKKIGIEERRTMLISIGDSHFDIFQPEVINKLAELS